MASLRDFAVSFGTSGARGLVTDLGGAYCWTFTQAFLAVLGSGTKILLVGHDLRPSSPGIAAACISAAESRGVNGVLAGPLPTPALALAAQELGCPAIMVTGSHIPADRNGLKAYRPNGEITKADEKAMLLAEVRTPPQVLPQSRTVIEGSHLRRYIARYVDAFAPHALQGLRIGVYEHSTVGRDVLTEILGALGAKTISLGRSDTFVPVDTEAIRLEDHELATLWASEHALDAIVSADGDADRPLLADERGQWLRGDVVGILAARELGAATVVTPVSSNSSLERSGLFQKVIRTRIGSPYVIAGME